MLNIKTNIDDETLVTVDDNVVLVELANIGEGYHGDYDPEDPDDTELVRFYVYVNANCEETNADGSATEPDWEDVEDSSCCTTIPCNTNVDVLIEKAKALHARFRQVINSYPVETSVKKLAEELSWI